MHLILASYEQMQIIVPYLVYEKKIVMHGSLSSKNIAVHFEFQANSQPWCIIQNLSAEIQSVTPKQELLSMIG